MMDFLAEYMLLAFAIGAILGGAVTAHLMVLFNRRPAVVMASRRRVPVAQSRPGQRNGVGPR